jgi:hypothetical protein
MTIRASAPEQTGLQLSGLATRATLTSSSPVHTNQPLATPTSFYLGRKSHMPISSANAKKRKIRQFRPVFKMNRPIDSQLQTPQSGILVLVDELLLAIIDQIDSKQTLVNLASTCSRFQGLVEPYIWRTLLVTRGSYAQRLAAALDSREIRPSYVHDLSIRYPDTAREGIEELNHFIGQMDKLRHLTIESPCPNNSEWTQDTYFDGHTRIDYQALLEAAVLPFSGMPPALPLLQSRKF